jgi:glutamine amidotransferase
MSQNITETVSAPPSGAGGLKIVIINYGAGNIQSIKFAIQRLGYEAVLSDDIEEIRAADKGLGIFDVDVVKFSNVVKVPQIGWNQIYNLKSPLFKGIAENEYMYLVHSFYAPLCAETIATTNYELDYSSALENDNFYGTQFHPEKSGDIGEQILKNFLEL